MAEKLLFMMPGRDALTIQGLVALYEAIKGRPVTMQMSPSTSLIRWSADCAVALKVRK